MANIPNRAIYGLLGCLKGVVDSRFYGIGHTITLSDLKHDSSKPINPIDVCPGGIPFHPLIARELSRKHYCPFLDSSSDTRMCEWVHSIDNDPQKSKPIGQCAIILEALGLVDLIRTNNGTIKKLKWNKYASSVKSYSWASPQLDTFLCQRLVEYGPVLGIIYFGKLVSQDGNFDKRRITQFINFPMSNDKILLKCNCGSRYNVILPDGNTSPDPASRSTKTLLCLAASSGLIAPIDVSYKPHRSDKDDCIYPSYFYEWYCKVPNRQCPNLWGIEKEHLDKILQNNHKFKRGISYDNLIPKSTDRNATNSCRVCNANLINLAKSHFGDKVKNRRYLLLESLRIAFNLGKSVSLKDLHDCSLNDLDRFVVNEESHFRALHADIQVANLTGYWLRIREEGGNYLLTPQIGAEHDAFDPVPAELQKNVTLLIERSNILL